MDAAGVVTVVVGFVVAMALVSCLFDCCWLFVRLLLVVCSTVVGCLFDCCWLFVQLLIGWPNPAMRISTEPRRVVSLTVGITSLHLT